MKQLGLNTRGNFVQLILVVFMMAAGFFISGALAGINEMIPISKTAADYFRTLEDNYNKEVMSIGSTIAPAAARS